MKSNGKKKTSNVVFNFIITISLVFMLVAVTFSWFTASSYDTIDNISIRTSSFGALYIVKSDSTMAQSDRYDSTHKLQPEYGDGENFFYPTEFEYTKQIMLNGIKMYEPVATEFEAEDSEESANKIFSFEVKLNYTSDKKANLVIGKDSSLSGKSHSQSDRAAAGCARLAIFRKDVNSGEYVKKCIWIPNSAYEVKYDDGLYVASNGTPEDSYKFMHDIGDETVITTSKKQNDKKTVNGVDYIWGEFPENYSLGEIEIGACELKVVIWIDGEDRECVNSLLRKEETKDGQTVISGGNISLSLKLYANGDE